MEAVDEKAREDIGKLWGSFRELAADYWGVNRDNGKRSMIVSLAARMDEFERWKAHYIDAGREESCHGLAELKRRDTKQDEKSEEDAEVKIAKINAGSASWVQFLQLAGILIVAIIGLLK